MTVELNRKEKRALRELGWSVMRRKARRANRIPAKYVPRIWRRDLVEVDEALGEHLVDLEAEI